MKRILAIGIILLFIGMSISSSTGLNAIEQSNITTSDGKTLYVGGTGPGNYTKIQDAIDDASDGDTVFVYSGEYNEKVIVDKSINLIGENKKKTTITGNFVTITITADSVVICGFTVTPNYHRRCIYVQNSSNSKIFNNTFTPAGPCVFLSNSTGNEIYSNTFDSAFCITLSHSHLNIIHNNTIGCGECGIDVQNSTNNIICYNEFFQWLTEPPLFSFGMLIPMGSNFNNVTHNNFHDNMVGLFLRETNENSVLHNIFSDNNWGILVVRCDKNNILYNTFSNYNNDSWSDEASIELGNSNENNIMYNIFSTNLYGESVKLEDSDKNNIKYNTFTGNRYGLSIDLSYSDNNNIMCNTFSGNKRGCCIGLGDSHNNNILLNNFSYKGNFFHSKSVVLVWSLQNVINNNNFLNVHVSFHHTFILLSIKFPNNWNHNYWGKPRIFPKPIIGTFGILPVRPWINFDWHPAQEPYNIEV